MENCDISSHEEDIPKPGNRFKKAALFVGSVVLVFILEKGLSALFDLIV